MKKNILNIIILALLFSIKGYSNFQLNSFELIDNNYKVVSKDGKGDYSSIQEAINDSQSFPYERITIFVKNGIYYEKIKIHEWNTKITLVGESKENTIILFDDYFNKIGLGKNSTFYTYTLLVAADDVLLKNLTIENSGYSVWLVASSDVTGDFINKKLDDELNYKVESKIQMHLLYNFKLLTFY